MSNYVRGILTTAMDAYGLVQSISFSGEADEDAAKDKNGDTVVFDPFDARVNATATVRFDREADLPKTGDVVTLSSLANRDYEGGYKVVSPPDVEESNEAGPMVTINLRRYLDGELPEEEES